MGSGELPGVVPGRAACQSVRRGCSACPACTGARRAVAATCGLPPGRTGRTLQRISVVVDQGARGGPGPARALVRLWVCLHSAGATSSRGRPASVEALGGTRDARAVDLPGSGTGERSRPLPLRALSDAVAKWLNARPRSGGAARPVLRLSGGRRLNAPAHRRGPPRGGRTHVHRPALVVRGGVRPDGPAGMGGTSAPGCFRRAARPWCRTRATWCRTDAGPNWPCPSTISSLAPSPPEPNGRAPHPQQQSPRQWRAAVRARSVAAARCRSTRPTRRRCSTTATGSAPRQAH